MRGLCIMRKLSASILAIIVLAAAVLLISPYIIGLKLSDKLQTQLKDLNTPELNIKLISFHNGWFKSDATISTTLNIYNSVADHTSINKKLNVTFYHGFIVPVEKDNLKKYTLGYASTALKIQPDQDSSLNVSMLLTLENHMKITVFAKNYNSKNATNAISIKDLNSNFMLYTNKNNQRTLSGTASLASSLFDEKNSSKVNFENGSLSIDSKKIDGLWYGTHNLNIGTINIIENDDSKITADDFRLSANQEKAADKINGAMTISLKALSFGTTQLSNFDTALSFKDLDIQSAKEIARHTDTINTPQHVLSLLPKITKLFGKGFTAAIDHFRIDTDKGPIHASLTLTIPSAKPGDATLNYLITHAVATGKLNISKPLVIKLLADSIESKMTDKEDRQSAEQQANKTVAYWIQNSMFDYDANHDMLSLNYQFKGGKSYINGVAPNFSLPTPDEKDTHKQVKDKTDVNKITEKHNAIETPTTGTAQP